MRECDVESVEQKNEKGGGRTATRARRLRVVDRLFTETWSLWKPRDVNQQQATKQTCRGVGDILIASQTSDLDVNHHPPPGLQTWSFSTARSQAQARRKGAGGGGTHVANGELALSCSAWVHAGKALPIAPIPRLAQTTFGAAQR